MQGHGGVPRTLPLVVVAGIGYPRCGWTGRRSTKSRVTALATVLDKYPNVGHQAKIYVDPDATTKYCKARPVPYAMQPKLAEPEHLENEGIIKPVHFADWVAPIVPVLKSDKKSVRICGNFKLTVNLSARQVPDTEDRGPVHQNGRRTEVHQAGPLPELE